MNWIHLAGVETGNEHCVSVSMDNFLYDWYNYEENYNEGVVCNNDVIHDHPSYLCCPDVLSMVGDPLSGKGCGSPNHI